MSKNEIDPEKVANALTNLAVAFQEKGNTADAVKTACTAYDLHEEVALQKRLKAAEAKKKKKKKKNTLK